MREERLKRVGEGGLKRVPQPCRSQRRSPGKGSQCLGEHSLRTVPKGKHSTHCVGCDRGCPSLQSQQEPSCW